MQNLYIAVILFLTYITSAKVIGPFALYTKSSDPNWNLRYIAPSPHGGYNAISDHVSDPSQIPQQFHNFYINSTGLGDDSSSIGNLVWGAQTVGGIPYSAFYEEVQILDVGSPIQPFGLNYYRQTSGYPTQWQVNTHGELFLSGYTTFYATALHATQWNADAWFWNFGGSGAQLPSNGSAITLWKWS